MEANGNKIMVQEKVDNQCVQKSCRKELRIS